jgi:hypothetical protein
MTTRDRRPFVRFAAVLACATLLGAASVLAQPLCIPPAIGVPGDPNKAPGWFTGAPGALDTDGFVDPRWNGALGIGHEAGEAQFRAVRAVESGTSYVYVSLRAHTDLQGSDLATTRGDEVSIGLADSTGANAYRITMRLNTTAASASSTPDVIAWSDATGSFTGRVAVKLFERWTGTAWAPLRTEYTTTPVPAERPMLPAWLVDTTRLWVSCVPSSCVADGAKWTVQLRIPLGAAAPPGGTITDSTYAAGLPLDGAMRAFHRIGTYASVGTPVPVDVVTHYVWPQVPIVSGGTVYKPEPVPSEWPDVSVDPVATCAGSITLASHAAITTTSATSSTTIVDPTTFVVTPTNNTPGNVLNEHVQATLRIADWGSAVGDSPDWTEVCKTDPADATSTPPGAVSAGDNLNLRCNWDVPDVCDYIDTGSCAGPPLATHYRHQCILAQLAPAAGASQLVFDREAYWNNMNVREASIVEDLAKVSVRGLPALPGGRDVYLYVETINMPVPPDRRNPDLERLSQELDEKLAQQYANGLLDAAVLEQRLATYRVHVFHDTGELDNGARVLNPQPSFGMYLHHKGPFDGWRHELSSPGLTKLGAGLYKLHLANDAVAEVKVKIESVDLVVQGTQVEQPQQPTQQTPPPPPPPYLLWLLALLLLGLLLWLLLRKK